jgi:beta-galactosidase
MSYNQFTRPKHVGVSFVGCLAEAFEESGTVESGIVEAGALGAESLKAQALIELLKPDADTQALATYEHYAWHDYAAITRHRHGSGDAEWIGTLLPHKAMKAVLAEAVRNAGIDGPAQRLAGTVTVREGDNSLGEHVTYLLNYSPEPVQIPSPVEGESLIGHAHAEAGTHICEGDPLEIAPWDLAILVR